MIKILADIDARELVEEYDKLAPHIQWVDSGIKGRQSGLQYLEDENPWSSAVGKSQGRELEYTKLNPFFTGTVFEQVINKYKLSRTRFMWVNPFSCYTIHKDTTPRVHIPLITNLGCYFVFAETGLAHLNFGKVFWVDTRKAHTFINCSEIPRLHLVGVVES
jgi:hypothetical protein